MSVFLSDPRRLNSRNARKPKKAHPWNAGIGVPAPPRTAVGHRDVATNLADHIAGTEGCYRHNSRESDYHG